MDTNKGANILVAGTHVKHDDHTCSAFIFFIVFSGGGGGGGFCYRNFVFLIFLK